MNPHRQLWGSKGTFWINSLVSHQSSKLSSDSQSFVKSSLFIKVEMMLQFHKLENFIFCLYLCPLVCNFAVKLA